MTEAEPGVTWLALLRRCSEEIRQHEATSAARDADQRDRTPVSRGKRVLSRLAAIRNR